MADQIDLEEDNTPLETEEGGTYLEPEESTSTDEVGFDPYLSPLNLF